MKRAVILCSISMPLWAPALLFKAFGVPMGATAWGVLAFLLALLIIICSKR